MNRLANGTNFKGYKTSNGNWVPFAFTQEMMLSDSIQKDLKGILFTTKPKKTVYVMHTPPYETNLDLVGKNWHIGSMAVKMFIEERQPYLTLHGHIHETVAVSGSLSIKQEIHYLCLPEIAIPRMIWLCLFLTFTTPRMQKGLLYRKRQGLCSDPSKLYK